MAIGTVKQYIESLPEKERKEFEQDYKALVFSELKLALKANDTAAIRKLTRELQRV